MAFPSIYADTTNISPFVSFSLVLPWWFYLLAFPHEQSNLGSSCGNCGKSSYLYIFHLSLLCSQDLSQTRFSQVTLHHTTQFLHQHHLQISLVSPFWWLQGWYLVYSVTSYQQNSHRSLIANKIMSMIDSHSQSLYPWIACPLRQRLNRSIWSFINKSQLILNWCTPEDTSRVFWWRKTDENIRYITPFS